MSRTKQNASKSQNAYRSIGEAASEFGLQTHVLRYWETKFPRHIKPVKRKDGRRMFRPADMQALRAVQILVHERGMTLKGARVLLNEQGIDAVLSGQATVSTSALDAPVPSPARALQASLAEAFEVAPDQTVTESSNKRLKTVLHEMSDLKARLDAARVRAAA